MNILVTGGAGYIGSHTVVELIAQHHTVVVADNLVNSNREVIGRLQTITGQTVPFYEVDATDAEAIGQLMKTHAIDAVMHFAGLKAVAESSRLPLHYYRANLDSALSVLEAMQANGVAKLVFSSSATVYGTAPIPYREDGPAGSALASPYGRTKFMIEQLIADVAAADPAFQMSILRYFNPIGAHESGLIGEDPLGTPNNLMPYITQVAAGSREHVNVFGGDFDTPDGSGVRDYIHVSDLANGHIAALQHLKPGVATYNLGSGTGTSVLELIRTFETATGVKIPYIITDRRAGDLPEFYANVDKAAEQLGWRTKRSIEQACIDSWNWQSQNPKGYQPT